MVTWRDVPGYEGRYQASDTGLVRGLKDCSRFKGERILKVSSHRGYQTVTIFDGHQKRTRGVHRLVMAAFNGWPQMGVTVNHIDGNKTNNALSNLEYCSHQENMRHALRMGLFSTRPVKERGRAGEQNHRATITEDQARQIISLLSAGRKIRMIAKETGIGSNVISMIKCCNSWTHLPR